MTTTTAQVKQCLRTAGYRFARDPLDQPIAAGREGTVAGRPVRAGDAPSDVPEGDSWHYPDIPRLTLTVARAIRARRLHTGW